MPKKPVPSADATDTPVPNPEPAPQRTRRSPAPAPDPAPEVDKLAHAHDAIVDRILEVAQGIKIALKVAKRQLKQGETLETVLDTDGETWFVYRQPPDAGLLRWCAEQVKGKAAAKEATAQATSLVLKSCVPGHDAAINKYLASLPPDTLKRYEFDAATLAAIEAARE